MSDRSWFSSNGPLWFVAIGAALSGVMLLAILVPRIFALDEVSWWVTVTVGVVIGAGVVAYGYAKRDRTTTEVTTPDH